MNSYMNRKLLLLNGPNLNLLGDRETSIYGTFTLEDIESFLSETVEKQNYTLQSYQSNHEGQLIDQLHEASGQFKGIIFNPGAYSHTSVALHDAIKAIATPVIEVHISNVFKRESFRHKSITASACIGQIVGLGLVGYKLAAFAFMNEDV